jgi:NitT/TauT family transport system substrate-binding protein
VLDVRRGDGPKTCFDYTWPAIAATDALLARSPQTAAATMRAIVSTHNALKDNVELAFEVGRKLFPSTEATLITELIRRDLPYYDARISPAMVRSMTQFSRDVGILQGDPDYRELVAAPARV